MSDNNKPTKVFKIGLLSISVWEKEGVPNKHSIQRAYKKDDKWEYTNQLSIEDLCVIKELIDIVNKKEYKLIKIDN